MIDCFSGSGTTLHVASELGRSWIGIDSSPHAIATTLHRFRYGSQRMGDYVTKKHRNHGPASLFSNRELAGSGTPSPATSIRDFTIYSGAELDEELVTALAEWEHEDGESHDAVHPWIVSLVGSRGSAKRRRQIEAAARRREPQPGRSPAARAEAHRRSGTGRAAAGPRGRDRTMVRCESARVASRRLLRFARVASSRAVRATVDHDDSQVLRVASGRQRLHGRWRVERRHAASIVSTIRYGAE